MLLNKLAIAGSLCGICVGLNAISIVSYGAAGAGQVNVRIHEGFSHGYVVLRDSTGKIIASGEDIQTVHGRRIESRLVFHFKDGSIDDDVTVATQERQFHLVSDHHIQKGPSFPAAMDMSIDTAAQQVRYVKDGGKEDQSEHMDLPIGLSNGIFFTLIRNLKITTSEIEIPYLALASKPRLIKLAISHEGTDSFSIGGSTHKADRYLVKVKLGGISGAVAPLVGKQPADFRVWVSAGVSPTVLRADGPLFDGGPVWSMQLASPAW